MKFDEEIDFPISIEKRAQDFIRCCLIKKPEQRRNARQLINHPFVTMVDETKYVSFTSEVSRLRILTKKDNKLSRGKSEQTKEKQKKKNQISFNDIDFLTKTKN